MSTITNAGNDVFQQLKISEAYESENNPRGDKFEGPALEDLKASVKEKGVLIPVIARPRKKGSKKFEIVAGNRRFRASKSLGLETIPARVIELADDEAREIQIVENLQREDVHPVEEGKAFRQMVEDMKYEVVSIAAKVGKPESYVRQRLFLTNLCPKAEKEYRKGEFTDGHAVLIAKLSHQDQESALEWIDDEWNLPTIKKLKEWIEVHIESSLSFQPWLKDAAANEAVGPCKECKPDTGTLFGDRKEGACTDLKCWSRKMDKYVEYEIQKAGKAGKELVKVSKEYGSAGKGTLSRNEYAELSSNKKKHCEFARQAIVAEGRDKGTKIWICSDKKCPEHGTNHTSYQLTPEEKAKRKKERQDAKAQREKDEAEKEAAMAMVDISKVERAIDAILELTLSASSYGTTKGFCMKLGLEPGVKVNEWGESEDYVTPLKQRLEKDYAGKLRLIIACLNQKATNESVKRAIQIITND